MAKLKRLTLLVVFVTGVLFLSGCGDNNSDLENIKEREVPSGRNVEEDKKCEFDEDCVPASCCHAEDVVNLENAPSCEGVACTAICSSVLDCGNGEPICKKGRCEIKKKKENEVDIKDKQEKESINNQEM